MLRTTHRQEIGRFYELLERRCDVLRSEYGHLPTPRDLPPKRNGWGTKGVYFFLEPGEKRAGKAGLRVVRIGSHSGATSSVESRIVGEHLAHWGRSRFRLQVGGALLRGGAFDQSISPSERDRWVDEWYRRIPTASGHGSWGTYMRLADLHPTLHALQPMVTRTIATMNIVWVEVADRDKRLELEEQCIRLLSNHLRPQSPIDPPSPMWLGRHAREEGVRKSGLWNVQHVNKPHTPGFLDEFQRCFR